MQNIKNIIQNTHINNFLDNYIMEEFNELEITNLGGSIAKPYHQLNWYDKITNLERNIIDSDAIRELDASVTVKSIFLTGVPGIGKSMQSILAMRDYSLLLIEKNQDQINHNANWIHWHSPEYYQYNEILELLHDRKFGNDEAKSRAYGNIQNMKEARFLVIDDFTGKKSGSKSEWLDNETDKLFQDIFGSRYGNSENNITIITSNDTREQLADQNYSWLSSKTYSRLLASCKRYARSNKTVDLRNN